MKTEKRYFELKITEIDSKTYQRDVKVYGYSRIEVIGLIESVKNEFLIFKDINNEK